MIKERDQHMIITCPSCSLYHVLITWKKETSSLGRRRFFLYVVQAIYRTTFLSAFPAVNPGVFRAGILIAAPVCGFLPIRDLRERTINVPNPVTTTLSPFLSASVIAPNTAATDSRDAFAVRLAFFATTSTKSAFVMESIHLLWDRWIEQAKKIVFPS